MQRGPLIVGALSLTIAFLAQAQTTGRRGLLPIEGAITNPDWTRRPSGEDVDIVYPKFASSMRASGRAEMQCDVRTDGKVENCSVVSESPPGIGFGEAALQLSDKFEMRPEFVDGKAVGGAKVNIPIRFQMAPSMDAKEDAAGVETAPSPTQLVLIRRLVTAENYEFNQRAAVDQFIAQFSQQKRPRLAGEALTKFDADVAAAKASSYALIPAAVEADMTAAVRGLNDDELKELVAFFEGPTGRKWSALRAGSEAREQEAVVQADFWRALTIRLCAVSSCAGG